MIHRRTIARPVALQGPALFTGLDASMSVLPAPAGTGIVLRTGEDEAPATIAQLSDKPVHPAFAGRRPRCTTLAVGTHTVAMTEHALGALAGLGITDAIIETRARELPIDDGSAGTLTAEILDAGVTILNDTIEPIRLREPIEFRDKDAVITAEPFDGIDYAYHLDYGQGSPIPAGTARWTGDADDFARSIAPARTFSTSEEAEQARAAGLFTRFTPADLLVIGPGGPVDNMWRFADEPARHKLLDLIGDLALLARPLHARVRAHKSGHADTHALCRLILRSLSNK